MSVISAVVKAILYTEGISYMHVSHALHMEEPTARLKPTEFSMFSNILIKF